MRKAFLLILFFTVILIYLLPYILTPIARNRIQEYLKTDVQLDRVGINLFTKSIILNDFAIENFLSAPRIQIKLKFRKKLAISKISFNKPRLILHRLANGSTNWDFLWQNEAQPSQNKLQIDELLIKDGTFIYSQNPGKAEIHGLFIYLRNYPSPISYIHGIPLFTRIKGKGHLPTEPKGNIAFSGNANLTEKEISFLGDIHTDNISLTYFNDFYPQDSQIQVLNGNFSLSSQAECIRDKLSAVPDVTVRNLQLKLTQDYSTGDLFELPVMLVVDFFDIYKEELRFTFEIGGTLSDPEFKLGEVITQEVSWVMGESIVRTIAKSPALIVKLGDKLIAIADKLKKWGLDLGKEAGKAAQQLGKPVEKFIEGLKGE